MLKIGLGLGIKSNPTLNIQSFLPETLAHIARVEADGGVVDSIALCNSYFIFKAANSFMVDVIVDTFPHVLGYKVGATTYKCSKLYSSPSNGSGDIEQTTAIYQPLLLQYTGERYAFLGDKTASANYLKSNKDAELPQNWMMEWKFNGNALTGGGDDNSLLNAWNNIGESGNTDYVVEIYQGTFYAIFKASDNSTYINVSKDVSAEIINNDLRWLRFYKQGVDLTLDYSTDGTNYTAIQTWTIADKVGILSVNKWRIGGTSSVQNFTGKMYSCKITNTDTSDIILNLDLESYSAATSELEWVSTSGEIWTLVRSAVPSTFSSYVVERTKICSSGINSYMLGVSLSTALPLTHFLVADWSTVNDTKMVVSGDSYSIAFYNNSGQLSVGDGGVDANIGARPSKTVLVTQMKDGTSSSKGQINQGTINTIDAGNRVPDYYYLFSGNTNNYYCTTCIPLFLVVASGLDATQRETVQDFLNDSIFIGELI